MHFRKIHSWKVDERIVAGENNFLPPNSSSIGFNPMAVNGLDNGVFVYRQFLSKRRDQFERMELRLVLKFDGAGCGNGKAGSWDK